MSVPGVIAPPLAISLTTAAPRSARSRTAARSASAPRASPPIDQQWPPGDSRDRYPEQCVQLR